MAQRNGMRIDQADDIVQMIPQKQKSYDDLCTALDWCCALFVVERPFRPEYLEALVAQHGIQPLLPAVGFVWTDTESAWDELELWQDIWAKVGWWRYGIPRKTLDRVMTKEERATLAALPDMLTVYRGFTAEGGENGYS